MDASDLGVTVITGAAGGMGLPAARRLAVAGRRLILSDMRQDRLEAAAAELAGTGARIELLAGDVSAPDYPARLLAMLGDDPLGALIHTAGLSPTMADAGKILEVNLFATRRLVAAVRPKLVAGSSVVLISSCSAYMVPRGSFDGLLAAWIESDDPQGLLNVGASPEVAYPLSKCGVIALVAHEAAAFGQAGARIASIAPGFIDTEMGRQEEQSSAQMRAMITRVPLARLGRGDEIASVAQFLCSAGASYVTGCDIKVDGGILAALGMQ